MISLGKESFATTVGTNLKTAIPQRQPAMPHATGSATAHTTTRQVPLPTILLSTSYFVARNRTIPTQLSRRPKPTTRPTVRDCQKSLLLQTMDGCSPPNGRVATRQVPPPLFPISLSRQPAQSVCIENRNASANIPRPARQVATRKICLSGYNDDKGTKRGMLTEGCRAERL